MLRASREACLLHTDQQLVHQNGHASVDCSQLRHVRRLSARSRRPRATDLKQETGRDTGISIRRIPVQEATPTNFAAFGQVLGAIDDGKEFDEEDAQLVLNQGTPRFYIMRLPKEGLSFQRITYHDKVTQCLGSIDGQPWYMAVAAPSGSLEAWPREEDLRAFRVPPGKFLKLHRGTWHAGPLFESADAMSFYNLELSHTNVTDHNTHDYSRESLLFELVEQEH